MIGWLRRLLENRRINKMGYTRDEWENAIAHWPVAARYQGAERDALFQLTRRFLARKSFVPGGDFVFTDPMSLIVATMACVPILHLGLKWYDHWHTLILYQGDFVPNRPYQTEDGLVHEHAPALSGEAWLRGPVILSWQAVAEAGPHSRHGRAGNVVIHELAHKLDMLREGANGAPPLHPNMPPGEWHRVFSDAWARMQQRDQHHHALPIDTYALSSPAEFFAVCSETFFEDPHTLQQGMPEVYRLLARFYRQQPLAQPGHYPGDYISSSR